MRKHWKNIMYKLYLPQVPEARYLVLLLQTNWRPEYQVALQQLDYTQNENKIENKNENEDDKGMINKPKKQILYELMAKC